jgi:hypothetical protein
VEGNLPGAQAGGGHHQHSPQTRIGIQRQETHQQQHAGTVLKQQPAHARTDSPLLGGPQSRQEGPRESQALPADEHGQRRVGGEQHGPGTGRQNHQGMKQVTSGVTGHRVQPVYLGCQTNHGAHQHRPDPGAIQLEGHGKEPPAGQPVEVEAVAVSARRTPQQKDRRRGRLHQGPRHSGDRQHRQPLPREPGTDGRDQDGKEQRHDPQQHVQVGHFRQKVHQFFIRSCSSTSTVLRKRWNE